MNSCVNEFKYINNFIVSIANQKLIDQKINKECLESYLSAFLQENKIIEFDRNRLYSNLTSIYSNYNEYPIDTVILSNYMDLIKKLYDEKNYSCLYNILGKLIAPIIINLNDVFRNFFTIMIYLYILDINSILN